LVTTEPAATTEFSPTVTPPMIVAPAAIQTFLSIAMGFAVALARR
jgi:3-polyprenyl-4-hydroxybenzoate decarboxylase